MTFHTFQPVRNIFAMLLHMNLQIAHGWKTSSTNRAIERIGYSCIKNSKLLQKLLLESMILNFAPW